MISGARWGLADTKGSISTRRSASALLSMVFIDLIESNHEKTCACLGQLDTPSRLGTKSENALLANYIDHTHT